MTEDVPFYVGLAREADGPLLELAVGSGRVAIPVAAATGHTVIGIDFSRAMLAKAREAAAVAGAEFDLRQGDMRDLESDPAQIRSTSEVRWPHYYCRLCEPNSRDLDGHLIRVWY